MSTEMPRVLIGSEGWFDDPKGDFYPEDLPEDWRLSYYNTNFNALLLDAAQLIDIPLDEVAEWPHDLQAPFRFLVAIHAHFNEAAQEAIKLRLQALGIHLGGIVLRDNEYEIGEIRPLVESLCREASVFVCCSEAANWDAVYEHGFFPCWQDLDDVNQVDSEREFLHGVVMVSADDREPRQLRALLEATEQRISQQGGFYLIYSEPLPDAQIMHNGITLCELLGIL